MAKKQQESGPGTFMILALVFFILASLILGVTTYMGFNGQTELEAKAKEADDKAKTAAKNAAENQLRLDVLRVAVGSDQPEDRQALAGAPSDQVANVLDEVKKLSDKVGSAGMPGGKKAFEIPVAGGADGAAPAIIPNKTLPQLVKEWFKMAQDAEARARDAEAQRKKAVSDVQAAQAQRDADKKAFDDSVANLKAAMDAKIKDMDTKFLALKTEADKAAAGFKKTEEEWAIDRSKMEEQAGNYKGEIASLIGRLKQALNPDPSDIEGRWRNWNPAKMAERMGTITRKDETFVNIQFGTKMVLVPGQTFVVIPPNRSLVEVLEREKALTKHHYEVVSASAREPFSDNEMIKGMVEITDVLGPDTARARITYENQAIRNPIGKGDQLFNMTLSAGEKEHVAFAGIVDLDGDGRPDTEQFVQMLEKNNLIVDAYLDLRTGQIKGKGMNAGTRFLILGPEAPNVGAIKKMMDTAKTNGTQLIDARMFMNLIGIKPPSHALPPNYPSVNLGTDNDAAAPKEGEAKEPEKK
jgi:hypothetical protein